MNIPTRRQNLVLDDGHTIRYTTLGDMDSKKPVLVFIVGSVGLGVFYHRLATHLCSHFVCVYFDRRGFAAAISASSATSTSPEPSTSVLIKQQASDAAALIETIKNRTTAPVYCFGTSFGATITLELLLSYPPLLETVILHEPMLPALLPEASPQRESIMRIFEEMQHSSQPFSLFAAGLLGEKAASATKGNDFWSQAPPGNLSQAMREALAAKVYQPAVHDIRNAAVQLVLMGSVESKALPVYEMVEALSEVLPVDRQGISEMVGAHFSFAGGRLVKEAASCILNALGLRNTEAGSSKI